MSDLSSSARDQTHILCIRRWILNHWTTTESLTWKLYTISEIPFRILRFRKQQFERWGEDVRISIREGRRRKGRWEQTWEKKQIGTKEIARHSNSNTLTEVETEEAEMHERVRMRKRMRLGSHVCKFPYILHQITGLCKPSSYLHKTKRQVCKLS